MISLILFIGIPGAGKTTLCDKLSLCFGETYDIKVFCYDKIVSEFSKESRNCVYDMVVHYVKNCKIDRKSIIFVDDNMYYKSMRKQYRKLAKNLHLSYLQIYIQIDFETACERNHTRDDKIPVEIIRNMFYKLEKPNEKDITITCNSSTEFDTQVLQAIKTKIIQISGEPYTPNTDSTHEKSITSYCQSLDLNLRRIVGAKSRKNPHLSGKYNQIKKKIYNIVKSDSKHTYSESDICKMFDCYI